MLPGNNFSNYRFREIKVQTALFVNYFLNVDFSITCSRRGTCSAKETNTKPPNKPNMHQKIYNSNIKRGLLKNHAHITIRTHKTVMKSMALPQPLISWRSTLLLLKHLAHIKPFINKKQNYSNAYFRFSLGFLLLGYSLGSDTFPI